MVRVAPIDLAYNPYTLWFDPGRLDIHEGDPVIVATSRGSEFGRASTDIIEVSQEDIDALKGPLMPVKRLAGDIDITRMEDLEKRGKEALGVFREMVDKLGVNIRPISVEFLFDGDKAVFYFEAEERVDFRDLVRKLASHFHIRVEMHQIGVRDEARLVGGIGHCGQELCCKRLGGDLNPVSIRMAKEQDLSLTPKKISGLCGRLMCCIRYEFEAYKDFKSRAPKINATVDTPEGSAKVTELDAMREIVSLCTEGEKPVRVQLSSFEPCKKNERPHAVGSDAWELAKAEMDAEYPGIESLVYTTAQLTGKDKLAKAGSINRINSRSSKNPNSGKSKTNNEKQRGKSSRGKTNKKKSKSNTGNTADNHKSQRRRTTKISSGKSSEPTKSNGARPGQKSSSLAHDRKSQNNGSVNNKKDSRNKKPSGNTSSKSNKTRNKNSNKSNVNGSNSKRNKGNSGSKNQAAKELQKRRSHTTKPESSNNAKGTSGDTFARDDFSGKGHN